MSKRLTDQEIQQRFTRLRNLENQSTRDKQRIDKLEKENQGLKQDNKDLRQKISDLKEKLETALLEIGHLKEKIFGRKKKKDRRDNNSGSSGKNNQDNQEKKERDKNSYQRPKPPDHEVTDTKHYAIHTCNHCQGPLSKTETVIRYVEDIILPQLLGQLTKTVTKHIIERGYCQSCGMWSAARNLRGQAVSLGKNIKLLIIYSITILDCSYEQVKTLTFDLYGLKISDGEIINIIKETSITWLPAFESIKAVIRAGPGSHMDETPWPIQTFAKHCYAWVMSAVNSKKRIYKLAKSRGKENAEELLGETGEIFVLITDCYAAYKNLNVLHQICWAHLYRKIRDLLHNKNLPEEKKAHVQAWHDDFKQLYADLRSVLDEDFNSAKRDKQEKKFRERIEVLVKAHHSDPKTLSDLKKLLIEYDDALFTCMAFDGIPCDNNRAEQDIRILVTKRKKCFGSKTEAGARRMEILLSVAWSTWYEEKGNFFPALAKLNEKQL